MGERFVSEGYKKLINALNREFESTFAVMDEIRNNIPPIAKELEIGRLEFINEFPASMYDREGMHFSTVLYEGDDGVGKDECVTNYVTGENGHITIKVYSLKGQKFSLEQKDDIRFLSNSLYMICGRARLYNMMRRVYITDSLTGASNINGFMMMGNRCDAMGNLSGYVGGFMNVKGLKLINKDIGFSQGDYILREMVSKIYDFMDKDEIIARLGGDNFVFLVRKNKIEAFLSMITPMVFDIKVDGEIKKVNIYFRIGLYDIEDGAHMGDVMNNTGTALNIARKEGADDVIWFSSDMLEREISLKKTIYMFDFALANNQFVVYYQPKVSFKDNQLCGAEALVRWIRDGRVIPPMEFIQALEQDGRICELDFYVMDSVCRSIREWMDAGIEPVKISVNFSKYHLKNDDFATRIISIINRYNIDPKYIEIELTESACYESEDRFRFFIDSMETNGVYVSIDDFGTGYSSLSLLKNMKVDVIKLDQSFIKSIDTGNKEASDNDMLVIKNIVNLINELDMDIIAEGVETVEEANFLRTVKCNMAQGYLFNKPMPKEEFEKILKGDRKYSV